MKIYRGHGMDTGAWVLFFRTAGWVKVRFFGVTIGNYFIGVQRYTKEPKA